MEILKFAAYQLDTKQKIKQQNIKVTKIKN